MEGPQYKQLSGPSRARYTNVRWLLRPPRDLAMAKREDCDRPQPQKTFGGHHCISLPSPSLRLSAPS